MEASRRSVLKGLAGLGAVAAGGVTLFPARTAAAAPLVRPEGTTLDSTVIRGVAGDRGYRRLVSGPGEPHVVRDDLGARADAQRRARRTPLLAFAHLTDIHVIDVQSPARVEFLDRFDDDADTRTLFSSAYRPQEFLCAQLASSIVDAVRDIGVGPVTGQALDFSICTGDNTDNAQFNELRWQIGLLDGTPVQPNSGGPQFEGVHDQYELTYDIHYWHPDGAPAGRAPDNAHRLFGFPTLPGLLDVAIAQFLPGGIGMPWYTCHGNHDGLVQGNFPRTFQLEHVAVGPLKVVSLPAGVSVADLRAGDPAALDVLLTAPARPVTPDPDRRILTRAQSVAEHFETAGTPVGHGYTEQNLREGTAYYVFDPTPQVRGIVLDTVNPNGESNGSLDEAQFAWLRARLEEVSGPGRDRLVLVFSHHTIDTMTNPIPVGSHDPADYGPRVLGEDVRALLLEFPNVVLWVNGHTHENRVLAHSRPGGGGFWEVNTAAHIDFPCQARLLELVDNRDGTLSAFATIVDADAPLVGPPQVTSQTTPRELAGLARELAANDWQSRDVDRRGSVEDRNVELIVPAPFDLSATPPLQRPPGAQPVPAQAGGPPATQPLPRTLPTTGGSAATGAAALGLAALGVALRRRAVSD